jgi:predicted nucleic-acid-binding protein
MTIGLDTNLLVRYVINDEPEQVEKVQQLFDSSPSNTLFLVNNVVLAELDWVLTHVYNFRREEFLLVIDQLFQTSNISFENPDLVRKACKSYSISTADFSDCLIGVINKNNGCDTIYTFDKDASQLESFTLLN